MRTLAVLTIVVLIAVGALYAKTQAVASFERAVATHQAKVNA